MSTKRAIELPILTLYAAAASAGGSWVSARRSHWRDYFSGTALVIVGGTMLLVGKKAQ